VPSQALLLIADIGGYTQFMRLHRLSLAHSEEITSRLLEAAIEAAPELDLVEIEGDGAFLCAFDENAAVADATLAMHRAFHAKQQEIAANTLCPCEACAQVGSLRLKFVAHAGEVAEQRIRNRTSLIGLDVITVHRMLKNSVPVPEYLLVSEAVYDRLDRHAPVLARLRLAGGVGARAAAQDLVDRLPARPRRHLVRLREHVRRRRGPGGAWELHPDRSGDGPDVLGAPAPKLSYAAAGSAALAFSKTSPPSRASTSTVSPSAKSPSRSRSASGFSTRRWIARLSGRAP
jgi:hypothetical protein